MKERITISIDEKLLKELDKQVNERIYASRSHGIEVAISKLLSKKNIESGGKKNA